MDKSQIETQIDALLAKAVSSHSSQDSLRFSQSACNVVHVMRTLQEIERS